MSDMSKCRRLVNLAKTADRLPLKLPVGQFNKLMLPDRSRVNMPSRSPAVSSPLTIAVSFARFICVYPRPRVRSCGDWSAMRVPIFSNSVSSSAAVSANRLLLERSSACSRSSVEVSRWSAYRYVLGAWSSPLKTVWSIVCDSMSVPPTRNVVSPGSRVSSSLISEAGTLPHSSFWFLRFQRFALSDMSRVRIRRRSPTSSAPNKSQSGAPSIPSNMALSWSKLRSVDRRLMSTGVAFLGTCMMPRRNGLAVSGSTSVKSLLLKLRSSVISPRAQECAENADSRSRSMLLA